jgi:hypothetical protein
VNGSRARRSLRAGGMRGQAAVDAVGVALALAVLGGGSIAVAGEHLADDGRVASGLAAAGAARVPAGSLSDAAGAMPVLVGGSAAGAVAVAEQLLAADVREEPSGSNGGAAVLAITDGHAEAWCADFVSFAYRRSGQPLTGGLSGGWRIAGARALRDWFAARGRWTARAVASPAPGDAVYFTWDHVGLVRRVVGDTLETIEGNADDAVRLRRYPAWRDDVRIDGFGRR